MGITLVVVASLALALMRGGRIPADRRGWIPLSVGLLMQVTAERADLSRSVCLLAQVTAFAAAVAFWYLRRRRSGRTLFTLGLSLNVLAAAVNGGRLPADAVLAGRLGYAAMSPLHVTLSPATHLPYLGDIIPMQTLHQLVSPGEILMMFGIFMACQEWCGRTIRLGRFRGRRSRSNLRKTDRHLPAPSHT